LIDLSEPRILVLDLDNGYWHIYLATRFSAPLERLQVTTYDPTGEGARDLIVLGMLATPVPRGAFLYCDNDPALRAFEIMAIAQDEAGFSDYWGDSICGEPVDLADLISNGALAIGLAQGVNLDGSGTLIEERMSYYTPSLIDIMEGDDDDDFFDYLELLEQDVLNGTDPDQTAATLTRLRSAIPLDAPTAQHVISQILFLEALNYELSGQPELAVTLYTELIQSDPSSIWSLYAWARLVPAP